MKTSALFFLCLFMLLSCRHLRKKLPEIKEVVTFQDATVYTGSTHYFFTDESGNEIDLPVSNIPDMEGELYVNVPPILLEHPDDVDGLIGANPEAIGETFELIRNADSLVVAIKAVSGKNYEAHYLRGIWLGQPGKKSGNFQFVNDSLMTGLNEDSPSAWTLKDDKIYFEHISGSANAKPVKRVLEVIALGYGELHLKDEKGQVHKFTEWDIQSGHEKWLGKWDGTGGDFLQVSPKVEGGYTILESTPKGPQEFSATPEGELIKYVDLNGNDIFLGHVPGAETGTKELADKKNCLVRLVGGKFHDGGYCRG